MLGFMVHIYCFGGKGHIQGFKDDNIRMRMFKLNALLSIVMSQNLFAHGEQGPPSARAGIYSIVCLLVLAPSSSYIVTDTNISAIIMQFSYCQAKAKTLAGWYYNRTK